MANTLNPNRYLLAVFSTVFLFVMHIFIPNLGGVIAQPREFLIWIGIFTIVMLSVINVLLNKTLTLPSYRIYVFLFAALLLSSSIFNPIKNMDMFIINAGRLVAAVVIWLSLHQLNPGDREKERLLLVIFASAAIESIIGIMQFYGLCKYIPITPAPALGMVGGAFQQQNLFASWMATGLVISLYLITTGMFNIFSKYKKLMFFVSVALITVTLVLAASRAGLLGLACGAMVIFLSRFSAYKASRRQAVIWSIAFIAGAMIGVLLFSGKGGVKDYTNLMSEGKKGSTARRMLMYKTSLEMFKEKPFLGQGFGNFSSLYMYYQAKSVKSEPRYKESISDYTSHPHNEIFKILAESGIAGITALLIVFAAFVKMSAKMRLQQAGLYAALLSPLLVHMMVEYPLELSTSHYLVFLIFLYMATSQFVEERQLKMRQPVFVLTLSLSALLYASAIAYAFETLYDYMGMTTYQKEYNEGKLPSRKNIDAALNNIYLRNWARPMYMLVTAESAARDVEKNKDFIDEFLKWSSIEKQRQPVAPVFYHDANVLLSMGVHYKQHIYFDEAMKTAEEGLSLYPNDKGLKAIRPKIVAEAFKTIFDGFQKRTGHD